MWSNNSRRQALRLARRGGSRRAVPRSAAAATASRSILSRFYTTEKILQLRTGAAVGDSLPKTLYRAEDEKENCGVGLIASLKSVPSRKIVERADEMLVRMEHRGGVGSDPASGDGSGKSKAERGSPPLFRPWGTFGENATHATHRICILLVVRCLLFVSLSHLLSYRCIYHSYALL
jgi:hypothetical protein